MSKVSKASKKTEASASPAGDSTVLASIADMLEDHRASIAADFKATFAILELRLDKMQTAITEHGQQGTHWNPTLSCMPNKFKHWRRGV